MSRASEPAITSPLGAADTTLGIIPDRIRGPVSSITATRLLVVPRSIPTIFELDSPKSIWSVDIQFLFDFPYQVRDVAAAVQDRANLIEHRRLARRVILLEQTRERTIDFRSHCRETLLRFHQLRPGRIIAATQLLQSHVQLEHFLEQLRRSVLGQLHAVLFQIILGASHWIAKRAKGVVQHRRHIQGSLLLLPGAAAEAVGVPLTAAFVKPPFQVFGIEPEPRRKAQRLVEVHQAEKDVPQPQLFLACGFSKTKPE